MGIKRLAFAIAGVFSACTVAASTASAGPFPGCNASSLSDQNLSGCDLRDAVGVRAAVNTVGMGSALHLEGRNLNGINLSFIDVKSSLSWPLPTVLAFFEGANLANANLRGIVLAGSFANANFENASGGQISVLSNVGGASFAGSTVTFSESILGLPSHLPVGVVALPVLTEPPCVDKEANWGFAWFVAQRSHSCAFEVRTSTSNNWLQAYWILNRGKSIHDAPTGWGSRVGGLTFNPAQAMIGLDLARVDLGGTDLSGAQLEATNLADANLADSNLSLVDAGGAVVPADVGTASVTAAVKRGAKLFRARLTGANINKAKLRFAGLAGVVTGGLKGTPTSLPVDWKLTVGYLVGPKANLTNASLLNADLAGIKLATANLTGVKSCGLKSKPASLPAGWVGVGSCLVGPKANLMNANLSNLDLGSANLSGTNLTGATLTRAKLSKASLTGVISSGLKGTPASLPVGWKVTLGKLVKG